MCFSRQTNGVWFSQYLPMETNRLPRIISADRFNDGLLITFDDGKFAFYPSSLLYTAFSQAEELKEADGLE